MIKITRAVSSLCAAIVLAAFASSAVMADSMMNGTTDRYGGPAYSGAPNLAAAAALVQAGGGAEHFSFATALTNMVGASLVESEVGKLQRQYGKEQVAQWLRTWDFAVPETLETAAKDGIKLPAPPDLHGKALASALVTAGVAPDGDFWTGYMLDHAISHKLHDHAMDAIDAKYGAAADADYHKITNQAMFDLAQALGATNVKLAPFH
jgi:hypothetical protein